MKNGPKSPQITIYSKRIIVYAQNMIIPWIIPVLVPVCCQNVLIQASTFTNVKCSFVKLFKACGICNVVGWG